MAHTNKVPISPSGPLGRTQLLDLPNEILLTIAESFYSAYRHGTESDLSLDPEDANHMLNLSEYHQERLSLARLCRASRRLRDVCSPIVYEEFVPISTDGFSIARLPYLNTMRPARPDRRLPTFLNTIVTRRDLAARAKRVHISADLLLDTPEVESLLPAVAFAATRLKFSFGDFLSSLRIDPLAAPHTPPPVRDQRCS